MWQRHLRAGSRGEMSSKSRAKPPLPFRYFNCSPRGDPAGDVGGHCQTFAAGYHNRDVSAAISSGLLPGHSRTRPQSDSTGQSTPSGRRFEKLDLEARPLRHFFNTLLDQQQLLESLYLPGVSILLRLPATDSAFPTATASVASIRARHACPEGGATAR